MLIIDGYNLLFAIEEQPKNPNQLEGMRERLIQKLRNYCQKKKCEARIYFDAKTMEMITSIRKVTLGQIEVLYTRESADSEIKASLRGSAKASMTVITSDRDVLDYAQRKGVKFMRSQEFLKELSSVEPPDRFQIAKESGISEEEAKYWMKEFGIEEEY